MNAPALGGLTAEVGLCTIGNQKGLNRVAGRMQGGKIDDAALEAIADTVNDEISPIDDQRSTAEYRRAVAPVFLKRAILKALS